MMRLLKETGNESIKAVVSSIQMKSPQQRIQSKNLASYYDMKHEFTTRDQKAISVGVLVRCMGRLVRNYGGIVEKDLQKRCNSSIHCIGIYGDGIGESDT